MIVLSMLMLAPVCGAAAAPQHAEVRVLIDISGSMRQNDPDNLRRPALRMLAGLLQPGTRAGVWTFARWVNNLVPVAEVDAAWKKRTQSLSEQITSPGQFTNIEEVLARASADWEGQPTTHARHLVLLTDGMVDVSKDAGENARSRSRILDELLPRLQASGVQVHTIALSERADHELMRRLAGDTGGWYQQVAEAAELQRVFLRMFEKVGKPDAVPLQDNRFVVDRSVSEATVLVFTAPDSPEVVLHAPDGERFTDSDLPAGIAWFRDQGYNLITLAAPQKGEWVLDADTDPDNRVMIVTDLKLQTSEVPTHIAVGEQARVEAHLTNRGKLVTRQAFLRLLEVRAEARAGQDVVPQDLNDSGTGGDDRAADGRYTMRYGQAEARPEVELLVAVDSPTFMREKRFRLVIHEPVDAKVNETPDGPVLDVDLQRAVLQDGAEIEAWQQAADGSRQPLAFEDLGKGAWQAPLLDASTPAFVRVQGQTRLGNLIERTLGPLLPPGVPRPAQAVQPEPPVPEPAAEPVAQVAPPAPSAPPVEVAPEPQPAAVEEVPPQVVEAADTSSGWLMPAILFGGFNLLLFGGGAAWYLLSRRRQAGADDLALDDLDDVAPETSPASADADPPAREDAA